MHWRISPTHFAFLLLVAICAVVLNLSAIKASARLYNLIVIAPIGALCLALLCVIIFGELRRKEQAEQQSAEESRTALRSALGDIALLGLFAAFCLSLTTVGFDLATFLFVWAGILMSGERRWLAPPIFSALFTLALIKGFGALFPFPMPLLLF